MRRPEKDFTANDLPARTFGRPQRIAVSRFGMAATAHSKGTEAAIEILGDGGNAVDAAVAAAFALAVCEPFASGLGGQTMMIVHREESRKTISLDGSSRAPHRVPPGGVPGRSMLNGHYASTVPSTPAVLEYVLRRYGTMKLKHVMRPAIELAKHGFEVTELLSSLMKREKLRLKGGSAAPFFLENGKRVRKAGSILRQPVLAETLKRIAGKGVRDFYRGEIARAIHEDMVKNDGLIRDDDLAQIPWPIERKPLSGKYGQRRVLSFPPPAAGRTLVEMLNILSCLPAEMKDPDTPKGAVAIARVIQRSNMDRRDRPFDPNFYPQTRKKKMLSPEYARLVAKGIYPGDDHGDTTHLSVMDGKGNAVGLTQSIERVFGSCSVTPTLGFLYNNYMSAFEYEDMTHPYYLRPNAVPWASVAPTIVRNGRSPWLVIGSPGSERITSSILQVLLRLERQNPLEAVEAPRLHCSLDGRVSLEISRMRDDIPDALARHGFTIDEREPYSFYMGCVQLVLNEGGEFTGVADPRRDGSAGGPHL